MDLETTLVQCAFFAADVFLLGTFYKLYRYQSDCLKSLQEAKCLEINSELPKSLNAAGGVIPYAAVSGNIKALAAPLRSRHISYLRGVIYERITTERKLRWSPLLQIWDPTTSDVTRHATNIPFGLYAGGFFKKQIVEVVEPLSAQELVLSKVYDDYQSHKEGFSEFLLGFFRGEHTVAFLDVENMLLEDTPITAVGKLAIENDKLKIMPPDEGLTYFLTPLPLNSLIDRIKGYVYVYKVLTVLMGTGTLLLLAYYSKKGYSEIKRRIDHARQLKRCEEARILRRKADSARHSELQEDGPKCVVCLENPVEVLILECGHLCFCLNCSERFHAFCPVCRSKIQRLVPAFLP